MELFQKTAKTLICTFCIFLTASIPSLVAAADIPPVIITGDETWSGDRSFTGSLVAGANIGIEVNNSAVDATVTTDGNITTHDNGWRGVSVNNGGKLTIKNSSSGKTFESVDNNEVGILSMDGGSALAIENMDIVIKNNPDGVQALSGGAVRFYSPGGNNTLQVTGRGNLGVGLRAADTGNGDASGIEVKNMNVSVSDYNTGIQAHNQASVSISSDGGANMLNVSDNADTGVLATDKGIINIDNMSASVEQNGNYGIRAVNGGEINFTNATAGNSLTSSGNGSHGISAIDNNGGAVSSVNISDLDVSVENNVGYGIRADNAGTVHLSGSSGGNLLKINNNKNAASNWSGGGGIMASSQWGGEASQINIENMDMEVTNNGQYGIAADSGGAVRVTGSGHNDMLVSGNKAADTSVSLLGAGIYASGGGGGNASTVDISGFNLAVTDNGAAGIFANNGGLVTITGSDNTLTASRNANNVGNPWDHGRGISTEGSSTQIDISGMNMDVRDNGAYGIAAEGGSKITITGSGNILNLYGNTLYGLFLKGTGSEIDISGMRVIGSAVDHALIGLEVDGTYKLTDSDVYTAQGTLFHAYGDGGKYILTNTRAESENGQLFTLDSTNAVVEASGSDLTGGIYTAAGKTSAVTMTESSWLMRETSNITNLTLRGSHVDMRGVSGFNKLTLASLASENTDYVLNTFFDAAGQQTDKIIVDGGDATGDNNILHVISKGTDGSAKANGYGIEVVNLDGATANDIDFSLLGGVVDSGAYEYELYRAPDSNYYLQGNGRATAAAKTVANMPAIHLSIVKTGLNEMRKRFGEIRHENFDNENGVWARTYAKHLKVDDNLDSKLNLYGVEAGYDRALYNDGESKILAGVMAGYLYADNIEHRDGGRFSGDSTAQTPSVGVYGTWFTQDGWFADVTTRYFFSMLDVHNRTASGGLIKYDSDRNFLAASAEFGKQFEHPLSAGKKLVFEPKIEAQYVYSPSKDFTTDTGNGIAYSKTQSFNTRAAVKFGYNYKTNAGVIYEPFVEVGANHEFDGKTDIKYAGGNFNSDLHGTGFDVALGMHAALSDRVGLFGDVTYENGSVYEGLSGQIGVRFSFGDGKKSSKSGSAPAEAASPATAEEAAAAKQAPAPAQRTPEKTATAYYAFDKAELTPSAKKLLDEVVLKIKEDKTISVILVGHTDSTGAESYNQKLSERRAKKAYDYLIKSGIEAERIAAVGKGELEPIASNATKAGRAQNRRVEVYLF